MARLGACWCVLVLVAVPSYGAEFQLERAREGVRVEVDGKPFTHYLVKSGRKPVLWPVIGPNGKQLTRGYPMRPALKTEKDDHVHQRSFWFTHGNVNGVDFWSESEGSGQIVHRDFVKVAGGETGVIETVNDWLAPDGRCLCTDRRRLTFDAKGELRWIDFDVTIEAQEKITFGDTKEGSFGVRMAGTMNVDSKLGGKIVNSEGQTDDQAWGKPAAWVDYHGPVEEEQSGIAILNHPRSFRFPTHWHVRTYGLFAANPFGLHDFYGDDSKDGSHSLEKGETFSLFYRVILHRGDEKQAGIAEAFEDYARTERIPQ